jgi:hypothetical protein
LVERAATPGVARSFDSSASAVDGRGDEHGQCLCARRVLEEKPRKDFSD